jgi:hypothetical protein
MLCANTGIGKELQIESVLVKHKFLGLTMNGLKGTKDEALRSTLEPFSKGN